MGRVPFPIRGNVVRLSYDPVGDYTGSTTECSGSLETLKSFYSLMGREGSAVSQAEVGRMPQLSNVFYWCGAIVTYGFYKHGKIPTSLKGSRWVIEMQRDGPMIELETLIKKLGDEMRINFHRKNIRTASS